MAARACLAGILICCWNAAAPAADCAVEAAALAREQSELPRLEVASPADRPPYCITLETLMAFAARLEGARRPLSKLGLCGSAGRLGQDANRLRQAVQPLPMQAD